MPGWPTFLEAAAGVNGAGLTVATAKLTKTGGVDAVFDTGAASNESIAGDGFLELVVIETNKSRAIGFSTNNPGVTRDEIDHGLYLRSDAQFEKYENGVGGILGTYVAGDVFRIARIGTAVYLWKNGELVHTFATTSTGAVLIDTSFFHSSGTLDGVRLYDVTAAAWRSLTWQATNATITAGTTITARRLTIAGPTLAKAGDHVIAILAGQGPDWIVAKSAEWEHVDTFLASTVPRWFAVLRRTYADTDPASYTFDLATDQQALGAILTYRNLPGDPASMSATSFAAAAGGTAPARTMSRAADLQLVGGFAAGAAVPAHSAVPSTTNRVDMTATLDAVAARLVVNEYTPRLIGSPSAPVAFASATSGALFSLALSGLPELGRELAFSPIVMGAIGLPIKGI